VAQKWTLSGKTMGFLSDALAAILKRGLSISVTKPLSWTGYTKEVKMPSPINNLIRLIDAICVSWDNPAYYPELENGVVRTTYCNFFVNDVAKHVGCNDFFDPITNDPLMADDIVRLMEALDTWQEIRVAGLPPDHMQIGLQSVQMWANQGYLTIAGQSGVALGSGHGHVCVIRPGILATSGKWGRVPVVANVGREMFIGRGKSGPMRGEIVGINEAFIQMPRFFSWKGK
jgi:hypothetical protein